MTAKEKVKKRKKWRRWLKKIQVKISKLLESRYIFQEIGEIIKSNPNAQSPALINHWIINNYVSRMSVGIRRLTDKRHGTVSLYRLIEDIANNPQAMSRDYFLKRYPRRLRDNALASRDFDRFANRGQKFINHRKLRRDLENPLKKTERIKKFVNKWIAHHDEHRSTKMRRFPTFNELDEALTLLDETACKYYGLINNRKVDTFFASIHFDWKKPLKYPWIIDKTDT